MPILLIIIILILYLDIESIDVGTVFNFFTLVATIIIAIVATRIQKRQEKMNKDNLEINKLKVLPLVRIESNRVRDEIGDKIILNLKVVSEVPVIIHKLFIEEKASTQRAYEGAEIYKILDRDSVFLRGLGSNELFGKGEIIHFLTLQLYGLVTNEKELLKKFIKDHILIFEYSGIINKNFETIDLAISKKKDFKRFSIPVDLERLEQFIY